MAFSMQRRAVHKRTVLLVLTLLSLPACMSQGGPGCTAHPANAIPVGGAGWVCTADPNTNLFLTCEDAQGNAGTCFVNGFGVMEALCLRGVWVLNSAKGACAGDCGNIDLPPNEQFYSWSSTRCTAGTTRRSICTAECVSTHEAPAGSTPPKVMCSGGKWVTADDGSCRVKECPALPAVPNVVWSRCPAFGPNSVRPLNVGPYPVGEQCSGSCASGFDPFDGGIQATCEASQTWTVNGKCEQRCSSPPSSSLFPNTNWNCGTTNSRSICTGTCAIGTIHPDLGAPTARCNDGVWVNAGGSCPGIPCTSGPPLPSVTWNCGRNPPIINGANCVGTCAPGSTLFGGALSATCNSGTWAVGAGRCEPTCPFPPSSTFFPNATWTCPPTLSRSQCTGTCVIGADGVSGPPRASCNNGTWVLAGGSCSGSPPCISTQPALPNVVWDCPLTGLSSGQSCRGSCATGSQDVDGVPSLTCNSGIWVVGAGRCEPMCQSPPSGASFSDATWSCAPTPSRSQCNGTCTTGADDPVSGPPKALCNNGTWVNAGGSCTATPPPGNCSDTVLEDISPAVTWPDNCTASPVVGTGVCVGRCSDGYVPAAGAPSPRAVCLNGTWQAQLGGCLPKNCTGNPPDSLTPNTTWTCGDSTGITLHNETCNGTCLNETSGGLTPAPLAKCVLGNWNLVSGSCTGGGKVRYVTFEAPASVVPQFIQKVESGEIQDTINGQMGVYRQLVETFPADRGFFNLQISNVFVAGGANNSGGLRRRSQRRKLAATQTETITLGFQLNTGGRGIIPAAQEAFVDVAMTNTQVISTIDTVLVGSAIEKGWLPPTYDFSQIIYAPSDENGTPIRPPAASVACYMSFDPKDTIGRGILDLPMGGGDEQLQLESEPLSESAEFSLCPNVDALVATFPYRATTNIASLSFTAVALALTPDAAFRDPSVTCTASAGIENTSSVVCRKKDGSSFSGGTAYEVLMSATFTCNNRQVEAYTVANFKLREAPKLTILQQGAVRPSVCAGEKELRVIFNYTMVGDVNEKQAAAVVAAVTSGERGLDCRVKLIRGATTIQAMRPVSTGTATVTCSGSLTAGSNIDINLILKATPKGCAPLNYTAKARVSITCCQPGSSYAKRPNQGSLKAKCWQHFLPGTKASQCQSPTVVHGIFNQGPAAAKLMFFNNQTNKCAARASVGTAVLECSQREPRRLSFKIQSSAVDRQARQLFMVQCGPPATASNCPGNIQWLSVRAKPHNASIVVIGNTKTTTFRYDLPAAAGCSCGTAFWSLYEAGTYTGLPKRLCNV